MNKEDIKAVLQGYNRIAAVKDEETLQKSLASRARVVFILFGNVMSICSIVRRVKEANKLAFVHIDLVEGLSAKEVAVEFIAKNTGADGIISTKQPLIKSAAAYGLITVQRFFLIDSMALLNLNKQINGAIPDIIEVLPGYSAKIIKRLSESTSRPIIASGLLTDEEDVAVALLSGATAVSTTDCRLW